MVKVKIEKWGSLEGLSISFSKHLIHKVLFALILIKLGLGDLPSFLSDFLTHYSK